MNNLEHHLNGTPHGCTCHDIAGRLTAAMNGSTALCEVHDADAIEAERSAARVAEMNRRDAVTAAAIARATPTPPEPDPELHVGVLITNAMHNPRPLNTDLAHADHALADRLGGVVDTPTHD